MVIARNRVVGAVGKGMELFEGGAEVVTVSFWEWLPDLKTCQQFLGGICLPGLY